MGVLSSINVSRGGVPKVARPSCFVGADGLEGDRQHDLRSHGGPDRAVCLYSLDLIEALQMEGHPINAGSIGENLTLADIDWALMVPGARLEIGGAALELTSYAAPCLNIAPAFLNGEIDRVSQKARPGWARLYARVTREGWVRIGDPVGFQQTEGIRQK